MSIRLVYDATAEDAAQPLPGCERAPEFWLPTDGVQHSGSVVGVRWRCARCGLQSAGVFGPSRELARVVEASETEFLAIPKWSTVCVYFTAVDALGSG